MLLKDRCAKCIVCSKYVLSSEVKNDDSFTYQGAGSEYSKQCLHCNKFKGSHYPWASCNDYLPSGPCDYDLFTCVSCNDES